MKVLSISEVLDLDAEMPVPAFKGTLTKLYDPTTGESDRGPWSFQNGELKQGSQTIKVTFKDRDPVPKKFVGKLLYLCCSKGNRGLTGLYAKDDEYKGEKKRVLWVTKTAEVDLAENAPTSDDEAGTQEQPAPTSRRRSSASDDTEQQEAPPANRRSPAPATERSDAVDHLIDTKRFLARRGNLARLAYEEAMRQVGVFVQGQGVEFTPEFKLSMANEMAQHMVQSLPMALYISGDRSGQADALPASDLTPFIEKAKERLGKKAPAPKPKQEPPPEPPKEQQAPPDDDIPF